MYDSRRFKIKREAPKEECYSSEGAFSMTAAFWKYQQRLFVSIDFTKYEIYSVVLID